MKFKKGDFITAESGAFGIVVDNNATTPPKHIEVRWSDQSKSTIHPHDPCISRTSIEEMKEALAPLMMEGICDGAEEDIVWFGYKGLEERSRKEIKSLFLELVIDG